MLNKHEQNGDNAIIGWLYEVYRQRNPSEQNIIKEDFARLYEALDRLSLTELDRIINPVCTLTLDHERIGFCEGVRVGVRLAMDLQL